MNLPHSPQDTIAAIATAPGRGGIGIVRVSGPLAHAIAEKITHKTISPRQIQFGSFTDDAGAVIDEGLILYFKAPHSFTGEDCLELQGHGGPVVLDSILQQILKLGARLAQPGEFSQRAFLNDKMDLAQAEAIADLIDASSQQAARSAINSLQGVFSQQVTHLVDKLTHLRMYVEAAIDFPEEDFNENEQNFLNDSKVMNALQDIIQLLNQLLQQAQQGAIIRDGIRVAIAGRPNAGKSSLMNALTERDSAIVTPIEGTTRDVLKEFIHIDGMPLHLIDTAGLRDSTDAVEQIGIDRAQQQFIEADRILLLVDSSKESAKELAALWPLGNVPDFNKITVVLNKIDLTHLEAGVVPGFHCGVQAIPAYAISAKLGSGLDQLKKHLKQCAGYNGANEGSFTARRRHIEALNSAQDYLLNGQYQLLQFQAGELLAEDLKLALQALGEITGTVTPDELLGKIFSSFCIGK